MYYNFDGLYMSSDGHPKCPHNLLSSYYTIVYLFP